MPESEGENTTQLVQGVLRDDLKMDSVTIQTAHRTGKAIPAGRDMPPTRHIIFKLMNFEDKISLLKGKREALKDKKCYITEDLTQADIEAKKSVKPVMDAANQKGKKVRFREGKLFIDGKMYRPPHSDVQSAEGSDMK